MRVGCVFSDVCLSFCSSVCLFILLSVCEYLAVETITCEPQGQGHVQKMIIYLFQLVIPLYVATGHK